jgi:hypothetical protein
MLYTGPKSNPPQAFSTRRPLCVPDARRLVSRPRHNTRAVGRECNRRDPTPTSLVCFRLDAHVASQMRYEELLDPVKGLGDLQARLMGLVAYMMKLSPRFITKSLLEHGEHRGGVDHVMEMTTRSHVRSARSSCYEVCNASMEFCTPKQLSLARMNSCQVTGFHYVTNHVSANA